MGGQSNELSGPDLALGVKVADVKTGTPLLGHAHGEAVILVRQNDELFATSASCTHYGGPLAEGLVVGTTVRCPWHHACFDLRTGAARGPALNPLPCFDVVREGDLVRVGAKKTVKASPANANGPVVILGAGPAGAACAETLRREGYEGAMVLVGAEPPVDRPNLSKDYLAGTAPEEWLFLRGEDFYAEMKIERALVEATSIDTAGKSVTLADGRSLAYGSLVVATGAKPRALAIDGAASANVFLLRTVEDSRAIIARAANAKSAVIIGASFIGLEAAASLRKRGLDVVVVGKESTPLLHVFGEEVGRFVQKVHEDAGVRFQLGTHPTKLANGSVELANGEKLAADLVVAGIGVTPRVELAERAGLRVDNGIVVDAHLRASAAGTWAIGDVARFPANGETLRIEHFAVAVRQGRAAALDILGRGQPYADVPFFWSAHHDVTISYVGHASKWDRVEVRGDLAAKDAVAAYFRGDRIVAVATIGRDRLSLEAEAAMEQNDQAGLRALLDHALGVLRK